MIQLHQFRPFWGLPNASPFCMKAETYLRYRQIDYKAVACNPRDSPSKQIPFITLENGKTITDSEQIIQHFEALQDSPMDEGLTAEQIAMAYFIRNKVEETLYWQITYMRWGDPQGWDVFLPDLKKHMKGFKGKLLPFIIRLVLRKQMARRGMTSANTEKSYENGIQVLDMLSNYLGKKTFFLDKNIRTLDMSLYGFLANIIEQPYPNLLHRHARTLTNLVDYCERMKKLIWADWQA